MDEINKFGIVEIIANRSFSMAPVDFAYMGETWYHIFTLNDSYFDQESCVEIIKITLK